ncbi:hypothetical protein HMPREF3218_0201164 [Prevotella bivia]|uniref:Uncharacterized protein n=1 Tax=Prevotella bivia TaxID=28125 RepID=A0A137SSA5_9BACT|nr:hypothetical protein HMPREF3202_01877 [Prevotella bivia]KXU58183.1 hypothetical protein HMPREF3218_0201164 [Prevotella bivia]
MEAKISKKNVFPFLNAYKNVKNNETALFFNCFYVNLHVKDHEE